MEEEVVWPREELLRVEVDTNSYAALPSKPMVSNAVVDALGLVAGQEVIAFMPPDPEDVWPGIVGFDPELPVGWQWYVELV